MKIEKNKVVTVSYTLEVEGEIVDQGDKENPLAFIYGLGQMIKGFESNLDGMAKGESYAFAVDPEEGYGTYNIEAVVELPLKTFEVDGKLIDQLKMGNTIQMQDQMGNPLQGKVVNLDTEMARLDFNHPLAGKTLNFSGEILDLRDATAEELDHGHVHGPGGHQH